MGTRSLICPTFPKLTASLFPRLFLSGLRKRSVGDLARPSVAPKWILDSKHVRENVAVHEQNCTDRNYKQHSQSPARIAALFAQWQNLVNSTGDLRKRSRDLSAQLTLPDAPSWPADSEDSAPCSGRDALLSEARDVKGQLSAVLQEEGRLKSEIESLTASLPNLTSDQTPRGDEPRLLTYLNKSDALPRTDSLAVAAAAAVVPAPSHVEIGTALGLLDLAAGAVSSGWGWYYLLGLGAQLEQALIQFALSVARRHGWRQVSPPSIVYSHIATACGFQPRDQHNEQQIYTIASADGLGRGKPELCLAGTSEIPLAGMQANQTLHQRDVPLKTVAVSRCFRAEAGARGALTRGLYRVHEFTKVEMFAWTAPDLASTTELFDELLDIQTDILTSLGLPCRVLEMPATDLGAAAARKCDIEAYFPSRQLLNGGWGEVTSASICTDYQTRRLATRLDVGGKLAFPWTVNGTALAVPRVWASIVENGWDPASRTVSVPECLRPWMDGRDRIGCAEDADGG